MNRMSAPGSRSPRSNRGDSRFQLLDRGLSARWSTAETSELRVDLTVWASGAMMFRRH